MTRKGSTEISAGTLLKFIFIIVIAYTLIGTINPTAKGSRSEICKNFVIDGLTQTLRTSHQLESGAYLQVTKTIVEVCDEVQCISCVNCAPHATKNSKFNVTMWDIESPPVFFDKYITDSNTKINVLVGAGNMGNSCEASNVLTSTRGKIRKYEVVMSKDPLSDVITMQFNEVP
jgi:hypothetical protein